MEILILKSFIPEIFISFSLLFQLIFNTYLVTKIKLNFLIIDYEVVVQTFFILVCVLYLYWVLKIEGNLTNFLFLNDESSRLIKLSLTIFAIISYRI